MQEKTKSQELDTVQDEVGTRNFDKSTSHILALIESADYCDLLPKPSADPNDPLVSPLKIQLYIPSADFGF
jgi:hypothetical protein